MTSKMSTLRAVWQCMFTPRLYRTHGDREFGRQYEPGGFEKWGDQVISSLYIMWNFGIYTSPLLAGFLYRKGYFMAESLMTLTKFVTSIGVILVMSFCIRGLGRANNTVYCDFVKTLRKATENKKMTVADKRELMKYDFEFHAWPVDFSWNDIKGDSTRHRLYVQHPSTRQNALQWMSSLPCQVAGYLAIHTFGLRMIYPGSVRLLQSVLFQGLLQGRTRLIEHYNGQRFKLKTRDNNYIDSVFVDKRTATSNGSILMICSEGNAGFYEIGIMGTPIEAGYSVLGWNHPGFGGSTGLPYPDQEQNAIDVVMQFATDKLGFQPENIILFGWSIGGYATTWAAMNYPDVKGVILDASFDDILPLAVSHMPIFLKPVVITAIRSYVNLNNYEQLAHYPGPVLLIRRSEDEILCTSEGQLFSNRGNELLHKLMRYRYPLIFDTQRNQLVFQYLIDSGSSRDQFVASFGIDDDLCQSTLESYIFQNSKSFPMNIGEGMSEDMKDKMALFLMRKYMKDYKSTHCTPLPVEMLQIPWDITIDSEYVFT